MQIHNIRPLTNYGIEEDADDPKEPAHLDYKYLKSYVGPLSVSERKMIKENDQEKQKLMKHKGKPKPLASYERKKYGGVRMCQRCLRTKVRYYW